MAKDTNLFKTYSDHLKTLYPQGLFGLRKTRPVDVQELIDDLSTCAKLLEKTRNLKPHKDGYGEKVTNTCELMSECV
jgi:hypothetical protein